MPSPVKGAIIIYELSMYLKKIELNGFKSFAEPTTLEFPPPQKGSFSITAIVGPNGSGKSNVADALRWVMGEQSLKQLRGKKSEDVIFGGSEHKGKMSVASVSVVLDNTDKRAPVDYEELVLTRKVYRSGESEYLINGNQVRLLDLHLMLAQAQFGQGSYSVIGQGMITQLLIQSAAERKHFFDEAVGIKEFQIKRHQAVLKLNKTGEHIAQADMLLAEVEPRMKSLKRQVKKLEQRHDIELNLRDIQEKYYVTVHNNLSQQIDVLESEKRTFDVEYAETHTKLDEVQTELAMLAKEESRQEQFEALQQEHRTLTQKKNDLERERAVLIGKLHTEYSKAGKQNVSWLENKVEQLSSEQSSLDAEVQLVKKQIKDHEQQISLILHELSEFEQRKLQAQRSIVEIEKNVFESRNTERLLPRSGYRAVEAILSNEGAIGGRVHGMVAELGKVEKKFQRALEISAGHHMTSIVVEDDGVAARAIAFLKQHQLGTATFLPINKIKARPIPHNIHELLGKRGVHGLAIDLIDFDETYHDMFSYVFGSTVVVDDVETARELGIGRVRMVTLDGDMMSAGGSMRGGFRQKTKYTIGFSANAKDLLGGSENNEDRLSELRTTVSQIDEEKQGKQEQLMQAQTQKGVAEHALQQLLDKQHTIVTEQSGFQQELSLHSLKPEEYDDMMKDLAKQKDEMSNNIDTLTSQVTSVEQKIKSFNAAEEEKRKRIFALQDNMQAVQTTLNEISHKKNTVQVELAKVATRREDVEEEMYHEIKTNIELLKPKFDELYASETLDDVRVEIEKLKYKLSLIGGIDEEVMQEYEETRDKYEKLIDELNDLKKASIDLEKLISELDSLMKKRHADAFKKIKKEFSRYFSILFEGGKAELVEVYGEEKDKEDEEQELEEDIEEKPKKRRKKILRGIDVVATPPGKKIKNIAALSGGERTLTSIALVCAILHTNPPPFVLLDEVEAALDEANTVRFTKILRELSKQSQFILITHNRATMHAADVLYGVTMGNQGVSKLLSVKLEEAKAVVD